MEEARAPAAVELDAGRRRGICPEVLAAEAVIIRTARLELRLLNPDNDADVTFIQALLSSDAWTQSICSMGHFGEAEAREYIVNRPLRMYRELGVGSLIAVTISESYCRDGTVVPAGSRVGIGGLILRPELGGQIYDLGFAVLPRFFRAGFAEEMSRGVLDWASSALGLLRVAAITKATNAPCVSLLQKLGFVERPGPLEEHWGCPQRIFDWHTPTNSEGFEVSRCAEV